MARTTHRARGRSVAGVARLGMIGAALLAAALVPGCGGGEPPSKVVLIGVDGMDWKVAGPLMDAGRMPNLARIVKRGVRADLRALAPDDKVRSSWICIAAGRVVRAHESLPPMAPDGSRNPGTRTWGARPFWDVLGDEGRTAGVLNWPYTWPASELEGWMITNGVVVAPEDGWDPVPDIAWPPEIAGALGPLRKPASTTTDDEIASFMNGDLWRSEEHPDLYGRAMSFKGNWAEDQTVLAVATHMLGTRGQPDLLAVCFGGLLLNLHPFWGPMDPGSAGFRDSQEIVSMYKDLVPRYYERVDGIIGEILARSDDNTTVIVCSSVGFRGPQRTADGAILFGTHMHGEVGLLAASGPGIARRARVRDASVLDLAPTILALLGAPVPRDMDGFVLTDMLDAAFLRSHPVVYAAPRAGSAPSPAERERPESAEAPREGT